MIKRMTKFAGEFPLCFESSEQYKEWKRLAFISKDNVRNAGPCTDCTAKFQKDMIWEGRCENPHVEFDYFPVKMAGKHIDDELRGYAEEYRI